MKYIVLTLFPRIFENFLQTSIINKAITSQKILVEIVDVRKFSKEKNMQVDDYGYGGNSGMVLMIEPWVEAINFHKTKDTKVILLSPQGNTLNQEKVLEVATNCSSIILLCGHYEGFDYRIHNYISEEISIGDYVLTGGEVPAMVLIDSTARLIEGVIKKNSLENESFNNNLLDYPVYTKPVKFKEYCVPDVLLSGNHEEIKKFRKSEQERITRTKRPDLYKKYLENNKEKKNG
jgi:tRNA (guanine37-N1)-methyltransferase